MDITALYNEHGPRLLAFLRARVSMAIAEEILHDVWVAVLKQNKQGQLPVGAEFRHWVFRVARNAFVDYHRKASTQHERVRLALDHPLPAADAVPSEQNELLVRLKGCIDKLSEPFRVVVQGRLEGESAEEMAERLGILRATIDSRYFKTLRLFIGAYHFHLLPV